jgi:general secretion pathway protein G
MRRAFTLIEMLVVIAIIAVLAALLLPVLARARRQACRTQCISQMKQIAMAIQEYVGDWDSTYPYGRTAESAYLKMDPQTVPPWFDVLGPYVRNRDVLICPSDTGETYPYASKGYMKRTPPFWKLYGGTSYDYPGLNWGGVVLAGISTSQVPRPALALLVVEYRPWHSDYDPNAYDARLDPATEHIVYCDGHFGRSTLAQRSQDEYDAYKRGN